MTYRKVNVRMTTTRVKELFLASRNPSSLLITFYPGDNYYTDGIVVMVIIFLLFFLFYYLGVHSLILLFFFFFFKFIYSCVWFLSHIIFTIPLCFSL